MGIKLCAFADEAADSLDGQIAALSRNGIKLIELRNVDGVNVADMTFEHAAAIKKKLNAANISVWSIGSPIGKSDIVTTSKEIVTSSKDYELGRLNRVLKLCEIFECGNIRIFSFFTCEHQKHRTEIIERLTALCACAKKSGVKLLHENERGVYGDTTDRVLDLLDNVSGLGSIFDPANFVLAGENAGTALDKLCGVTDYFHIKDAVFSTGQIVPAGEGDGMIPEIIKRVSNTVFTLEPHLKVFGGLSKIDKHELKSKYNFATQDEAFDFAVAALKKLLAAPGCPGKRDGEEPPRA